MKIDESLILIGAIILIIIGLTVLLIPAFGFEDAVYLNLSDPMALDILQKINLTRMHIADLEAIANHTSFVEERRQIAVRNLNTELVAWELFYEDYSGKNVFNHTISTKPAWVQPVFWDLWDFTDEKRANGTKALLEMANSGGNKLQQQYAYVQAAGITKQEMIYINANANVKHKLAIKSQQEQMFDRFGQFINSTEVQNKLNNYYTDYKADPDYLVANPLDSFAYNSTKADVRAVHQCSEGKVLIYRNLPAFDNNDATFYGRVQPNTYLKWACVTPETAEIWYVRGLAV